MKKIVLGETTLTVTQVTPEISQEEVTAIYTALLLLPTQVTVRFKNYNGILQISVTMVFKRKISKTFTTPTDEALIEAVIAALGMNLCKLEHYNASEHAPLYAEEDLIIELFGQFLNSPYKAYVEKDWVADNGIVYQCVTFTVGYNKTVKFCLEKTDEIVELIKSGCAPEVE